jgi:hypothetical protein
MCLLVGFLIVFICFFNNYGFSDLCASPSHRVSNGKCQGGDPLQRNASDAAALAAKIAAKQAKAATESSGGGGGGGGGPPVRKKVDKKGDSLDDLLSAGLDTGKKKSK